MQDSLGNPVTVSGERGLAAVNAFVDGFISCESRVADVLAGADDPGPIVQAYCGAVHLFAESADGPGAAAPFIDRALAGVAAVTPREARFVQAVAAWHRGEVDAAIELHHLQAREHPRDLASLKLGQYHCFNIGDMDGMLRMALAAHPAADDVPYLHGMTAFGYEQCNRLAEAEASARRAIGMLRKEPWAHHALGHVLLTQGRLAEGLAFMRSVSDTWTGLNSFMVTHNWWHLALFLIDLGHHAEALEVYDRHAWGVAKDYSQDQIGAVSLLARLELAGIDVGNRWADVAEHLRARTDDHVLPFLDLQYLYGLARAGLPEADALLAGIEAHARDPKTLHVEAWKQVCVPAAHGLRAFVAGSYLEAADRLGPTLPLMVQIGGSHAQRDLFDQIYLEALLRAGTDESLATARAVLGPLRDAQPESLRIRAKSEAAGLAV
ncbi:conserved hypothetical protein [Burkholderiales bacterium 8X]|nr:conserved hypothetical protein [Burkholderiales bacterium 8X]